MDYWADAKFADMEAGDYYCVGIFNDDIESCYYIYTARVVYEEEDYDFTRLYYVKHRRTDVYQDGVYTAYRKPLDNHVLSRMRYDVNSVQDALEALGWNNRLFKMLCIESYYMKTQQLLQESILSYDLPFFIVKNISCIG